MRLCRHDSPIGLLDRAGDFLGRAEAEHNLILGICTELAQDTGRDTSGVWLLTVEDEGSPVGAALMTPPHRIVISRLPPAAVGSLVDFLLSAGAVVPGVAGPSAEAAAFARSWSSRTSRSCSLHMDQRIYACERVQPIESTEGCLRPAIPADKDLLVQWRRAFQIAVRANDANERGDEIVEGMIARRRIFVWEGDVPVSCAAFSRETKTGVAINYVYTPPEFRGSGYATACVAALTRQRLAAGRAFCCLYTDLGNPTSNRIYQRIGYRPVCDAQVWDFA